MLTNSRALKPVFVHTWRSFRYREGPGSLNRRPGMCTESLRMVLKNAHSLVFQMVFSCLISVARHGIPVAHVEIADSDEVIREVADHAVTRNILDA